jgi:hypothetical protein
MTVLEQVEAIEAAAHANGEGRIRRRCLDLLVPHRSLTRLCKSLSGRWRNVFELELAQVEDDMASLIVNLRAENGK